MPICCPLDAAQHPLDVTRYLPDTAGSTLDTARGRSMPLACGLPAALSMSSAPYRACSLGATGSALDTARSSRCHASGLLDAAPAVRSTPRAVRWPRAQCLARSARCATHSMPLAAISIQHTVHLILRPRFARCIVSRVPLDAERCQLDAQTRLRGRAGDMSGCCGIDGDTQRLTAASLWGGVCMLFRYFAKHFIVNLL